MTKILDAFALAKMLGLTKGNFLEGSPDSAPQLSVNASKHSVNQDTHMLVHSVNTHSADQDTHRSVDTGRAHRCESVQSVASHRPAVQPQSHHSARLSLPAASSIAAPPSRSRSRSSSRHPVVGTRAANAGMRADPEAPSLLRDASTASWASWLLSRRASVWAEIARW